MREKWEGLQLSVTMSLFWFGDGPSESLLNGKSIYMY